MSLDVPFRRCRCCQARMPESSEYCSKCGAGPQTPHPGPYSVASPTPKQAGLVKRRIAEHGDTDDGRGIVEEQPPNRENSARFSPFSEPPTWNEPSSSFTLATLMLMMTGLSVFLAIAAAAPGLGILLGFLALPPLVRTIRVVNVRAGYGDTVTSGEKTNLFLVSFGVTLLGAFLMTVVTLAATAFCCATVGTMLVSVFPKGAWETATAVGIIVFLTVLSLFVYLFYRWGKIRWEDDTNPRYYRRRFK